jgi:hypothetical protein
MSPTKVLVIVMLGFVAAPGVRAAEQDVQALLSKVDVSQPGYGTRTFGEPKVNAFKGEDGSVLLVYQARFGGDGDHTENRTKVFRFTRGEPKKVLDVNLDSVTFVESSGALITIRGNVVETFCDVCDGPDAAEPEDLFFIPVAVDLRTLSVTPTIDARAREALLARARARAKKNSAEEVGNSVYRDAVVKRVEALLSRR